MPVLPYLTLSLNGTSRDVGILAAAYQFTSIFAMPLTAKLSDLYGRRKFFLLGFVGSFCGFSIIAFADRIWMLALGRGVGGCFAGSMVGVKEM